MLENNEVSIRENGFTKFRIEYGKRTNELLEFVKGLYLDKRAKERECNNYKQALDEIRQYRVAEINDEDEEKTDTILTIIDEVEGL